MNLLLESMTPLKVCGYYVRVWRQESLNHPINNADLVDAADDLSMELMSGATDGTIARRLIELPRVNAVEVLDGEKRGVVLYRDWP